MDQKSDWVSKLSRNIVNHPKKHILWVVLLFLSFLPGLLSFEEKYDVRIWFRDSDEHIKTLNQFERQFGNDENIVIALRSEQGIFTKDSLEMIHEITEKLWLVPEVLRVDSLTNYQITRVEQDDLYVEDFLYDDVNWTEVDLEAKKEEALSHRVIPHYLVSEDGLNAMIFARLVPTLDGSPNYANIVNASREIIASYEDRPGYEFHLIGEAAVNDAFREVSNHDTAFILPLLILLIVIYLLFAFRSVVAVTLPLIVTTMALLMSFGLCFMVGYSYNQILSILPAIVIAISIADSVHIIVTFFQYLGKGKTAKEATLVSLEKNLIPTILTTLSTMIGFLGLTVTELLPIRELGVLSAAGALFAWIATLFLVAPILSLSHFKVPEHFKKMKDIQSASVFATRYIETIKKFKWPIVSFFTIIILVSAYLTSLVRINSNPYDYFTDNIEIRHANKFIENTFGGNSGPELLIESGSPDGVKNVEFLKKVEKLKDWINSRDYVNKTIDIVDVIKEMNQNMNQGDPEFYKLPESQKHVAEYLFLYSMSLPQGMDMTNRVSLDYEAMRISVLWSIFDTRGWLKHVAEIEEKADELNLSVKSTGKFLLFQRMTDYVVMTFFQSVIMALFFVAILMTILFRSLKLGLLSLVPNILPLFFGGAFMYLMDIDLNIGSAIVASVCLGIAVDDTIHFLSHYYKQRALGLSRVDAMSNIMTYTGSALLFTTTILVSGFSLYLLADFIPSVNFGQLCAVVLTGALAVDLIYLPALLFCFQKEKQS